MNVKNITGLMGAFDFVVQFTREEENKIRFSGNGTFIDLWHGKKGLTIGVYNPATSSMQYHKFLSMEKLEEIISKIHYEYA